MFSGHTEARLHEQINAVITAVGKLWDHSDNPVLIIPLHNLEGSCAGIGKDRPKPEWLCLGDTGK